MYFTDALGGGVYRWSDDGVDTIVPKRRGVGGLALHADGGVVVSGRDVTHVSPDGTNRLLFAAPEGVTGFNDICATSNGSILAGGLRFMPFTGEDPVPGAFWHVTSPEQAEIVLEDVEWPNGVGDAGDGIWCFCDYSRGRVTVVTGDDRRVLTTPSGEADGLAFDIDGGVWVAQPRAVTRAHHPRRRQGRPDDRAAGRAAGEPGVRRRRSLRHDDRQRDALG